MFLLVEMLCWSAQAIRSGVWTYYEATGTSRQEAMYQALRQYAPNGFAETYLQGMQDWRDQSLIRVIDDWIGANDSVAQ